MWGTRAQAWAAWALVTVAAQQGTQTRLAQDLTASVQVQDA